MTTENSRADALMDERELLLDAMWEARKNGNKPLATALRNAAELLAASPVEQPAAAPIATHIVDTDWPVKQSGIPHPSDKPTIVTCACGYSVESSCNVLDPTCRRNAAPAPADERAAFDADDLDFEPDARHTVADMANIGYALLEQIDRMAPGYHWNDSPIEIVSDLISERDDARAASASETGAEGAKLEKPAKVGGVRFGVGVKWSTVIGAAQRLYEYEVTPEKEAARIERARGVLDDIRDGKYTSSPAIAAKPNQVYVEARQCDRCDHIGINDGHNTDAACGHSCGWSGPSPTEDKCPGCGEKNCMGVACPKCSGLYTLLAGGRILADEVSAPARAMAAEAVAIPAGWMLVPKHRGTKPLAELIIAASLACVENRLLEDDDRHELAQFADQLQFVPSRVPVTNERPGWTRKEINGLLDDADRLSRHPGKAAGTIFDCARVIREFISAAPQPPAQADARDVRYRDAKLALCDAVLTDTRNKTDPKSERASQCASAFKHVLECSAHPGQPETAAAARIEQLRKALFESRDAMRVMSNWVKKSDPAGHAWGVHMVDRANAALNGEPEPRAEVTPMKVERHSDMSVLVVFGSCRQASVFEKEIAARTGTSS